jgi:hypothetical protein
MSALVKAIAVIVARRYVCIGESYPWVSAERKPAEYLVHSAVNETPQTKAITIKPQFSGAVPELRFTRL